MLLELVFWEFKGMLLEDFGSLKGCCWRILRDLEGMQLEDFGTLKGYCRRILGV